MAKKKSKHEWRANSLPAAIMVGPVSLWMVLLVAIPLIYVGVMSFCSIDQYYNVTFQFTLENYTRLMNADYIKIYSNWPGFYTDGLIYEATGKKVLATDVIDPNKTYKIE